MILGIETSCDECSASVVRWSESPPNGAQSPEFKQIDVLSVATFSQVKIHEPYGGVVPEVASRNHLETINEMIDQSIRAANISLKDLQAIAVTNRPGLVGALLVGVSAAKALAYALNKPLVPVHHLEGHAMSLYLKDCELGGSKKDAAIKSSLAPQTIPQYPMLLAIVSGGHTNLYCIKECPALWGPEVLKDSLVAQSRDDAAGEAFDKTAKLLGFPYPGGQWIDQTAKSGRVDAFDFPRAMKQKSVLDMSFSGLKTAVSLKVASLKSQGKLPENLADLCASLQEAILDALLGKVWLAVERYECQSVAVVGGVAANSRLRALLEQGPVGSARNLGLSKVPIIFPKLKYCTDNAAMIGAAGLVRHKQGHSLSPEQFLNLNAIANPR